ncbi:hypothetical protein [Neptunomonas phycophila]|uniref:hypothetical protein n=1 Tax=Neptunomonas phycophila TaxID=1572645 RepID=UPI003512DEE9
MVKDERGVELKWWITSLPLRVAGMSGEPFSVLVLLPLLPFPFFIKLIGWLLLINIILNLLFRKTFKTFLLTMTRLMLNNRHRIYNSRDSIRRFRGY